LITSTYSIILYKVTFLPKKKNLIQGHLLRRVA